MAKRFAPALRRSSVDPRLAEMKTLTVMGPGIVPSTITLGAATQSRAAGWNLDAVVADAYERSVWVFKAVELYANHAGRLPVALVDEDTTVEAHPLLRTLNVQANPLETGRAFKKRLAAQLLLSKVGVFVEVTTNRAGTITRLDLLAPDRVRIVIDQHGDYVDYFEYTRPDGEIRNLPPERVLWIRDPHPTDPFSGVTPIEAAGVSIELDHLARIYNTSFIKRDARPGGILGVDTDQIDERELERIEKVFQPGAHHAGRITAIGTGPGGLHYIDTSARPRDMAYEHTSAKAKDEVLAAFGLPESLIGNTAGRTYDNASQDEENWARFHLLPFLELITDAFARLVDPDLELKYDTSSIEALELPKKRARAEAREEWNMGLRTALEYRALRPELDEIDNAHTRALWFAPSKAPVPGRPEDAAELGMEAAPGAPGGTGTEDLMAESALLDEVAGNQVTPAGMEPGPAGSVVAGALPGAPAEPGPAGALVAAATPPTPSPGAAAAVVESLNPEIPGTSAATGVVDDDMTDLGEAGEVDGPDPLADLLEDLEGKSLETKAAESKPGRFSPDVDELRRVELAARAALDALIARQAGVIKARLESPKARRGTRFWEPSDAADPHAGTAPVDTTKVLAAQRWATEAGETMAPVVSAAAEEAALNLLTAMAASGALVAAPVLTAQVAGRTVEAAALAPEKIAELAARAAAGATLAAVVVAETAMAQWISDMNERLDAHMVAAQPNLTELLDWVETNWAKAGHAVSDNIALSVAQTALGQARDNAAAALEPTLGAGVNPLGAAPVIERTWTTRGDERVRSAHAAADGQARPVGESFTVGGAELRWPSDPLAPAPVARGCRCWLTYSWPANATFTART